MFIKFRKVIASISCPLVLVLEDLQWIHLALLDIASCLGSQFSSSTLELMINRNDAIKDALATGKNFHKGQGSVQVFQIRNRVIRQKLLGNKM